MMALLRRHAHQALLVRRGEYEKIKTPEDVAAWQERMRKTFLQQLGPMPQRTPLHAQITGRENRGNYCVEKILFQSRPGFYVTGNLYLPAGRGPFPAVLVPCGHSRNGKAYESYQRVSILLARNGLAAFCFDPISQGERTQIFDEQGRPLKEPTLEHTLIGTGDILLGGSVAGTIVWDAIRAVDYLVSREDIDAERIGCGGTSGGGTQTSYLTAIDPRIRCAAVCCFFTSLERLIDTAGPQDAEQNLFNQVVAGPNHADLAILCAPRPLLFGTATRDFFDIEGAWDTFRQTKRIYTRLGVAERVDIVEADLEHNLAAQLRVPLVQWMRRWLCGIDEPLHEPETAVVADEALHCTPKGQVQWIDGARSAIDLNADRETELAKRRQEFWRSTPPNEALAAVRKIAGIRPMEELPDPTHEVASIEQAKDHKLTRLVLHTQSGMVIHGLLLEPTERAGEAYLYLAEATKDAHASVSQEAAALVRSGNVVLTVNLPGMNRQPGQEAGDKWEEFLGASVKEFFLAHMFGRSYVGIRAEAIIGCGRFLAGHMAGDKAHPIHLVAGGEAGPAALHAAALEPGLFCSLELRRTLTSWTEIVRTSMHRNQLINAVHGALAVYDLPDLAATLAGKMKIVETAAQE